MKGIVFNLLEELVRRGRASCVHDGAPECALETSSTELGQPAV